MAKPLKKNKQTDQVKDYDAGGQLLGAGSGALSGAASLATVAFPWGMIAGAVGGGVMGLLGASAKDKAEARQKEAERVSNVQKNRQQQYNNIMGNDIQIPTFEPMAFGGVLDSYYTPASRPVHNMYALGGDINEINQKWALGYNGWMANGGPYEGLGIGFMNRNNPTIQNDLANNPSLTRPMVPGEFPEYIGGTAPVPGMAKGVILSKGALAAAKKAATKAANSRVVQGAEVVDDLANMPKTVWGFLNDPNWKKKFWEYENKMNPELWRRHARRTDIKLAMGGQVESPAWYGSNALSLAAGGHLPEGNATLKEAKDFAKKFPLEMKMGEEVEYEHTGNKKLAQRIAADHVKDYLKMTGTPGYYTAMKQAGISDELNKMDLTTMKNGGVLSVEKAKEILKHGKVYGKPLSERQKGLFGLIAGGGQYNPDRANGGPVYPKGGAAIWDAMGGPMYANGGFTNVAPQDTVIANNKVRKPLIPNTQAYADSVVAVEPIGSMKARQALANVGKRFGTVTGPSDTRFSAAPQVSAYEGVQDTFNSLVNRSVPMEQFRIAPPINLARPTPIQQMDTESFSNYMRQYYPINRAFGGSVPGFAGTGRILDVGSTTGRNQNNNTDFEKNIVTKYDTGGTHEENRYGGIQVGPKARVEEGEYRFDDPDTGESYIFSNRF